MKILTYKVYEKVQKNVPGGSKAKLSNYRIFTLAELIELQDMLIVVINLKKDDVNKIIGIN